MSKAASEESAEIEMDFDDSLTCSESNILIWKVLDILSNTRTESPFFTFQGITFCMILELNFCKNIRDDSLEMYIKNCGAHSGEFRDFQIRTCIKTIYGEKYVKNATVSSSVLRSRKNIWSEKRKSLLIDYNNLIGCDTAVIVKFFCTFEQESEFRQQLSNEPEKSSMIGRLYPKIDELYYLTRLSSDFRKIFDDDIEADMTLTCGDINFCVQKAILLARCEKFAQECSDKGKNGTTEIRDMESSVLGRFLEYVYTGHSSDLTEDIAVKVYNAGYKYDVKHLPHLCREFLKENLSDNNVLDFLLLSDKHDDKVFKKEIIGFLIKNDHILRSCAWTKVSGDNPKLACEVFQLAHKMFSSD